MKIIGFVAPKGGGKDASYEILKKKGKAAGKLSFAGPLKEICSEVFKIPLEIFNDPTLKEKPFKDMKDYEPVILTPKYLREVKKQCYIRLPEYDDETGTWIYTAEKATTNGLENRIMETPRQLLQIIGTDFIRNKIYQEWHLRAAFHKSVISKLKPNGLYCVTDIRFANEYEFLKQKFGEDFEAYYVERPEAEERLAKATHPSELGVLDIKALIPESNVIKNDKSLSDLEKKLVKLAGSAKKKTSKKVSEEENLRRGRWVSKKAKSKGIS